MAYIIQLFTEGEILRALLWIAAIVIFAGFINYMVEDYSDKNKK